MEAGKYEAAAPDSPVDRCEPDAEPNVEPNPSCLPWEAEPDGEPTLNGLRAGRDEDGFDDVPNGDGAGCEEAATGDPELEGGRKDKT